MGDIVPISNNSLITQDPEKAEELRAERIKEVLLQLPACSCMQAVCWCCLPLQIAAG
jgi:hypothetical protein